MTPSASLGELVEVPLKRLEQDNNLRELAEDDSLKELAESIKVHGVLEPVLVESGNDGKYRLVAGYRRCAAAKRAGLIAVPAIVQLDGSKGVSQNEIREIQLVENVQRKDLSPLEEAKAFASIVDSGVTQAELAKRVGKSQPYVANRIRLLDLPEKPASMLASGQISPAIAEKILKLPPEEKGAIGSVVRKIQEAISYRGVVGVKDVDYPIRAAVEGIRRRKARNKVLESLKFPDCPVRGCGKKGTLRDFRWNPGSRLLTCPNGHAWSGITGKRDEQNEGGHHYSPPARPAPPTLPAVDPKVLTEIPLIRVIGRISEALGEPHGVSLRWMNGNRLELTIQADAAKLRGVRLPDFDYDRGHKFLELRDAQEWDQRDDAGRKSAAQQRVALETWLATFGTPGRKPGSSAPNSGDGA